MDLSPLNAVHTTNLAYMLMADGQYAEAREWARRSLEISPENARAYMVLGHAALANGDGRDALASYGKSEETIRTAGSVAALHSLGRGQESRDALVRLERDYPDEPIFIAGARAWRGDRDGAFAELDRAVRERSSDLANVKNFVLLRPLHGDPRFDAILRSLNLPVGQEATPASPAGGSDATPSIAVLPFADMSPKHDQEYFADGVAEEILNGLAQVQGLKVIGRTSSFSFKGKSDDIRAIGQKLGVANVLEGSLRRSGGRLRITAQLVKATDGVHLWSQTFDRPAADVFAVQDEIARAVVEALRVRLLPGSGSVAKEYRPKSQEAYQSYLLGKHFALGLSADSVRRAIDAFQKAVALDPDYPQAWAALARARISSGFFSEEFSWTQARRDALAASTRAVELAPDLPMALAARAVARTEEWDWSSAKADIDRALDLDPESPEATYAMLRYLRWMGRSQEAIPWARKWVSREPLSSAAWNALAVFYWATGRLDEAERAFLRALEVDPLAELSGNRADLMVERRSTEEALAICRGLNCISANLALGNAAEVQKALDTMLADPRGDTPFQIASVYASRGEPDKAFEWLDRARRDHLRALNALKSSKNFSPSTPIPAGRNCSGR